MKKVLMVLSVLTLMITGVVIPANAKIHVGDSGSDTSIKGGGSSEYNYTWVYSRTVDDFGKANKRTGSHIPSLGMEGRTTHGVFPTLSGWEWGNIGAVRETVRRSEPQCLGADVRAVFMIELTKKNKATSGLNFYNGYVDGNVRYNKWEDLLTLYKNSGGKDQEVIEQLSSKKGYIPRAHNVVCVTPDEKPKQWVEVPVYEATADTKQITCPAFTNVTVTPQIVERINGVNVDPIGENNLNTQSISKATPFYTAAVGFKNDKSLTPTEYVKRLQQACNQSTTENKDLNLNAGNKAGLAEGGVLNVTQNTTNITFTSTQTSNVFSKCTAFEEEKNSAGKWVRTGKTKACVKNHVKEKDIKSPINTVSNQTTPKNTGFWQMLSVHCNAEEFNKLVQATGAESIKSSTNPDGSISALAYSKSYTTVPKYLDFGDKTNPNADKARSGNLGFYDKECPYKCTPEPNTVFDNIRDKTPKTKDNPEGDPAKVNKNGYGIVSDDANTNELQFFRDNEKKEFTVDTWYPQQTDGVNYTPTDSSQNKTTTIVKWAEGTPSDNKQFKMFGVTSNGEEELFKGAGNQALTQKNDFGTKVNDLTKNKNTHMLNGVVNTFKTQASWASDSDKPHKFNIKWEYAPKVTSDVPNGGIGFDMNNNAIYGTRALQSATVEGKCYAQFGTNTVNPELDTVTKFRENTGTGTTNNLDNKLITPEDNSELYLSFIRSVSE